METLVVSNQPPTAIFSFLTSAPKNIFFAPYFLIQEKNSFIFYCQTPNGC
jgi:hypothetical protein